MFALDLEKVGHQNASHSCYSTKNGDLLTLDFKNSGLGSSGDVALVYLIHEIIWSLRDGAVDVHD